MDFENIYSNYLKKKSREYREKNKDYIDWFSASSAGSCLKKQWYKINDIQESDLPNDESMRKMRVGTLVHEDFEKSVNYHIENKEDDNFIINTEQAVVINDLNVIGHLEGNCHVYVDKDSELQMAKKIVLNSKMRRTSICGAAETLLIDSKCIKSHALPIIRELVLLGCEVVVDKKINKLFQNRLRLAKEIDWKTEYLSPKISIKTVNGVKDAVSHIIKYGTMHTDSIVTKNKKTAKIFLDGVNSAIAIHNASTQFADGGEFGFGGEIGISTNKLPPRGPVGINQLTSYKYVIEGKGTIRP